VVENPKEEVGGPGEGYKSLRHIPEWSTSGRKCKNISLYEEGDQVLFWTNRSCLVAKNGRRRA